MYNLGDKEFHYITKSVYDYANINLTEKKRSLVISRLSKRIRILGMNSFEEYIEHLKSDPYGPEFQMMIDSVSTNYTLFFREKHHFEFLTKTVLPANHKNTLKIWSAASSTGQEIYSILMTIKEYEEKHNVTFNTNLFASDISRNVLTAAAKGIYNFSELKHIHKSFYKKYFLKGKGDTEDLVMLKPKLIRTVRFFRLNLSDPQYNLPQMDVIFLRNVIIYFDQETKHNLINKLYNYIKPGGYLILGHSETLSGISNKFKLIGKTIYQRM